MTTFKLPKQSYVTEDKYLLRKQSRLTLHQCHLHGSIKRRMHPSVVTLDDKTILFCFGTLKLIRCQALSA